MNIPEEVLERADEAFFTVEGDGLTASYAVIAEWARKEALLEVADTLPAMPIIADRIRALAEGEPK